MVIQIDNIQKKYPAFHLNASLEVSEGRVTGLIGLNGAGKSTAFKAILGLIRPDSGTVRVFGKAPDELTIADRQNIGVVFPDSGFSDYLNIKEISNILASFYPHFGREAFLGRCREFALAEKKPLKTFSTGMKAKLKVLTALSHNPQLLILDEPTAGLDVVARDELLNLLREYMEDESHAILVSSHISTDLEGLCDDIYMIHQGAIALHEDTDVLLDRYGLLKVSEADYPALDKQYLLRVKKEAYGYSCLTGRKQYYQEYYPDSVIEKGSIDEIIMMTVKGERL